jgi:hypothetical protein
MRPGCEAVHSPPSSAEVSNSGAILHSLFAFTAEINKISTVTPSYLTSLIKWAYKYCHVSENEYNNTTHELHISHVLWVTTSIYISGKKLWPYSQRTNNLNNLRGDNANIMFIKQMCSLQKWQWIAGTLVAHVCSYLTLSVVTGGMGRAFSPCFKSKITRTYMLKSPLIIISLSWCFLHRGSVDKTVQFPSIGNAIRDTTYHMIGIVTIVSDKVRDGTVFAPLSSYFILVSMWKDWGNLWETILVPCTMPWLHIDGLEVKLHLSSKLMLAMTLTRTVFKGGWTPQMF